MYKIEYLGKTYYRNYEMRFCQLPGCGQRIQYRLDRKGAPESSDKYNKRRGCCKLHGRKIQQMRVARDHKGEMSAIDKFLYGRLG